MNRLLQWLPTRLGLRRFAAAPGTLLGEESNQRWVSLLRNLGGSPQGQLKALELIDSQEVLEQKPFRDLLEDVARQLPRDVGEKTAWESTGQLASVLKKLNAQSLHPRLGTRLNNALLQNSDAKLEEIIEKFCGNVADDYTLWLLNRKLGGRLDSLKFEELVAFLHLLAPLGATAASTPAVSSRVRQRLVGQSSELPTTSATWAQLLQIYDQEASAIQAWEILDALMQQKVAISNWNLPEMAVLGSMLERHGLPRHENLAEELLKKVVPQISEDSDLELMLLCISGGLKLHTPTAEMAQKASSALAKMGSVATSGRDALQIVSLSLRLWPLHKATTFEVPKKAMSGVSRAMVAKLLPLCASAGASFTGQKGDDDGNAATALASLRPFLEFLEVEATSFAKSMEMKEFCSSALALARLGLGHDFLTAGDLEARLGTGPSLEPSSTGQLLWAMAALDASKVAWSLIPHLSRISEILEPADRALLFEALSSQAIFNPKSLESQTQVWKRWAETWSEQSRMPRSENVAFLVSQLQNLAEECEAEAQIGQSPWKAPILFNQKKIILDLLPTARHPASGKTRGDLMLKHNTWAEHGYTVLVIPDAEWDKQMPDGQKSSLKWIKDKVSQLQKQMILQNADLQDGGFDEEVTKQLMQLELGPRGINTDGLKRLSQLSIDNQKRVITKYKRTLLDSVKNPTAWLFGIIKKEEQIPRTTPTEETASAVVRRPEKGWSHDGRGLDQVREGELLMGKVTNIMGDRVWVDIGLVKDGSFIYKGDVKSLKPGKIFRNLKVSRVDRKREWVEVEPKVLAATTIPDSPPVPLAKKPSGGWGHKEGKLLAEYQLGTPVEGQVTNVLYDRVWVQVGAAVDATFKKDPEKTFKVGDSVSGEISFIDLNKKILRMSPTKNA